jgi:ubiquinone/menaquinone biosynthesis C-methylase UbiE
MDIDGLAVDISSKVLEAGCSTDLLTPYMVSQGAHAQGMDKSPAMINQAKINFPHLNFEQANIHNLPYADEYFDAVVAASLINIVPNKEKAMQEMVRVCKTGGKVSIFVPLQGFTPDDLSKLMFDLKVTKFSKAAM